MRVASTAALLLGGLGLASALSQFGMKNQTYHTYLYTYPILETYKVFYQEMVEPGNPVFNQWKVQPVPTVDTKGPQPSLDTLDAIAWVDLRDQPMIIRVPLKYDERYWVIQSTHLKGGDAQYVGTRQSYDKANGSYIMFGPNNIYKTDPGGLFKDLLWCDSDFVRVKLSVALKGPDDVAAATEMMKTFQLVGLKEFLEPQAGMKFTSKKAPSPVIKDWPVWNDKSLTDGEHLLDYIPFLNFMAPHLKFGAGNEARLINESKGLGINSTDPFSPSKFEPYQLTAMKEGAQLAYDFIHHQSQDEINAKYPLGADKLKGNEWTSEDIKRHAVRVGQSGPLLPMLWESGTVVRDFPDAQAGDSYKLKYEPDKIPGVNNAAFGFWTITVYSLPDRKLVSQKQINSFSPEFQKFMNNGGVEATLANTNPGYDAWLPTPAGPFSTVLRIYAPAGNAMPVNKAEQVVDPQTFMPVIYKTGGAPQQQQQQQGGQAPAAAAVKLPGNLRA